MSSRIATLESLYYTGIALLGQYIPKNKFESEEEKFYKIIKERKRVIDNGLLLNLKNSLTKLAGSPGYDKSNEEKYLTQLELVNLAIFAYNVFKGNEYETCANNFFQNITNDSNNLTDDEIEFYVKLRHMALATHLKETEEDLEKAMDIFFPSEPPNLFFENGKINIEVIGSVRDYRDELLEQSKDEIMIILNDSNDFINLLQVFVSSRYKTSAIKLGGTLKRPNTEESNVQNKAKKAKANIVTPNVDKSEKAKYGQLVNKGTPGRRIRENEVDALNNAAEVMGSDERSPREDTDDPDCPEKEATPTKSSRRSTEKVATPAQSSRVEGDGSDPTGSEAESSETFSKPKDKSTPLHRKIRKKSEAWEKDEVIALENGLRYFRRPAWRYILVHASPVLDKRSDISLKDKARTMIRDLERRGCTEPDEFGPYKYVKTPDESKEYLDRKPKPKPKPIPEE